MSATSWPQIARLLGMAGLVILIARGAPGLDSLLSLGARRVLRLRDLAPGLVLARGWAQGQAPLCEPVFQEPCVCYLVSVHAPTRGEGNWWQQANCVYRASSRDAAFRLADDTASAVIEPDGGTFDFERRVVASELEWTGARFSLAAADFMKRRRIRERMRVDLLGFARRKKIT